MHRTSVLFTGTTHIVRDRQLRAKSAHISVRRNATNKAAIRVKKKCSEAPAIQRQLSGTQIAVMQRNDQTLPTLQPRIAMTQLADRYDEIMNYRAEALAKYRADAFNAAPGPRSRVHLPSLSLQKTGQRGRQIGPLFVSDRPPVAPYIEAFLAKRSGPAVVLEIGPGRGDLARHLRTEFGSKIACYFGIERDESVAADGLYHRLPLVSAAPSGLDLIIAAEVIEHMSAEDLYREFLEPLGPKLASDASLCVSTPNPLSPGGIGRDFTHVQGYPWYDLYAIMRLLFDDVDIIRTHYVFSYRRLIQLLPRVALCTISELDWCDQLVCFASKPRANSIR